MKFKHLTLLIGGSLLLAGCSGELLPNTEETAQNTPITRTATLTAARPSIPAQTPAATPDMAGTIVAVSPFHVLESRPSPDGLWRVEIVAYECATVEGWNEEGGAMSHRPGDRRPHHYCRS